MSIIGNLVINGSNCPMLGHICWWNIKCINISRDNYQTALRSVGLDEEKFAPKHNYRCALVRCLKHLEEQRIIRKVSDGDFLVYQFTAENLIEEDGETHLQYTREEIIKIDKDTYNATDNIEEALECSDRIKPKIIQLFNDEKSSYGSSDITRYIQNIFKSQSDIVSLRQQGSVYFVPYSGKEVINKVKAILSQIVLTSSRSDAEAGLDAIPIPDVEATRSMVSDGVSSEIAQDIIELEKDIEKIKSGESVGARWVDTRLKRVSDIKNRMDLYKDVLGSRVDNHIKSCVPLLSALNKRKIEIE